MRSAPPPDWLVEFVRGTTTDLLTLVVEYETEHYALVKEPGRRSWVCLGSSAYVPVHRFVVRKGDHILERDVAPGTGFWTPMRGRMTREDRRALIRRVDELEAAWSAEKAR